MDTFLQNCLHLYQTESAVFTVHSRIQLSISTIPNKQTPSKLKTAFIKTMYLFEYKINHFLKKKKIFVILEKNTDFGKLI